MNPVRTETNPRWENAPMEQAFIAHARSGLIAPNPPLRYESREDFTSGKAIPPYLTTFEDGHTEETW